MRKNKETIILAKIRRLIRRKTRQFNLRNEIESMHFWDREDYKRAKRARKKKGGIIGNYPYYSKSTRAINDLAKEIYNLIKNENTK